MTGDISVPAIAPDSKFHGSLQIAVKTADFSLNGSKQPEVLHEPLGMFGIQILSPVLRLHYDFEPFSYNYELSGSVEFYSHPGENSSDSNASTEPKKPSATLTAKCVFMEGTPKVVDISLEASESPLTAADFVATVFNANWDMTFLNIGFYSGRLYYANIDNHKAVHSPSDTFQYKSEYFMACKTFIFTDDFQFDIEMSIPLDKTGFSISGRTPKAIDCGLFKVSTGDMDTNGDFLDAGPSLSYSYSTHDRPQLSLETFLDVTIAKTDIKYTPQDSNFVFTVTYPKKLLGVKSPAISFTWSREGGFQITNWPLINPSLIGLNEELTSAIIQYLAQPSSEGCSAIVGLVIEKNTITSKFDISMSTANKSKWNSNDLFALQLGGTYSISIVGNIAISSVDLPDIVVHLPTVENDNLTMGKVANYILNTVKDNAGSMAQQLIQQSDRLAKLIGAMALKKMAQEALVKAVNSFMCRGVEESKSH